MIQYDQLAFDLDALTRLVDEQHANCARICVRADANRGQLRDRRRIETGAPALLAELIRNGLDERALVPAAALALTLDEPRDRSPEAGSDGR
jgi:hypothetical protein